MYQDRSDTVERLIVTLARQRALLERLLFKLVLANLVLAAGEGRFAPPALAEVETAAERLRAENGAIEGVIDAVAAEWGRPVSNLPDLVEVAPADLRMELDDHLVWLTELVTEIEVEAREHRQLAAAGTESLREAFGIPEALTYGADGMRGPLDRPESRMEQAL